MRVLDLFSGIGGFSLGLERAGMETVAFCESDEFCQKVLNKNWPDVPVHNDIKELDGKKYDGAVELVCGGFPCQPFSVAGKRLGAKDDRSLWPEMFRVICEARAAWVIAENVPGIIKMELDQVLSDLESGGYSTQAFTVPACAVDAPHKRERVWVVAHSHGQIESNGSVNENERSWKLVADSHQGQRNGENKKVRAGGNATDDGGTNVADAASQRVERNRSTGTEIPHSSTGPWVSRCDGSGGRAAIWKPEPGVGRVADGIPRRVDRLRALGNAGVPQLAEEIGRLIYADSQS